MYLHRKAFVITFAPLCCQDCPVQKGEAVDWLLLDWWPSLNSVPDGRVLILISFKIKVFLQIKNKISKSYSNQLSIKILKHMLD